MLVWRCQCGSQFEELGRKQPGNVAGWMDAKAHAQEHRNNNEPEVLTGLWDTDTGELLFKGGMRPTAVKEGILPYADSRTNAERSTASPLAGKILVREIPIDPVVYVCFLECRQMSPRDYPDDSPMTISKFITECVLGLFRLCPETFTMSKIIEAAVRGSLQIPDGNEMVPLVDDLMDAGEAGGYYDDEFADDEDGEDDESDEE